MRRRLIEATIDCLDRDGYSGATISRVVERAGVSRGAHLHHFESKAALLHAAADHLMRSVFRKLGAVLLGVDRAEERIETLIDAFWDEIFMSRDGKVILELLIAARTDKELSSHLAGLFERLREIFTVAARHYFVAAPGVDMKVEDIFFQTQWLLRGMLLDAPIVAEPALLEKSLNNWKLLLNSLVRARTDVAGPPPRPVWWDD